MCYERLRIRNGNATSSSFLDETRDLNGNTPILTPFRNSHCNVKRIFSPLFCHCGTFALVRSLRSHCISATFVDSCLCHLEAYGIYHAYYENSTVHSYLEKSPPFQSWYTTKSPNWALLNVVYIYVCISMPPTQMHSSTDISLQPLTQNSLTTEFPKPINTLQTFIQMAKYISILIFGMRFYIIDNIDWQLFRAWRKID